MAPKIISAVRSGAIALGALAACAPTSRSSYDRRRRTSSKDRTTKHGPNEPKQRSNRDHTGIDAAYHSAVAKQVTDSPLFLEACQTAQQAKPRKQVSFHEQVSYHEPGTDQIPWEVTETENQEASQRWILGDTCLQPARAKEVDAKEDALHQKARSRESDDIFVDRHWAHEIKQPGDGSCLFHSLCYGLNDGRTDAHKLRRNVSRFIRDKPDVEIADMPLKDWVQLDSGISIRRYATKMAAGAQGGAIEIEVFTKLTGMSVHVYERCSGGYRRTCCFDGVGQNAKNTVNLLYRRRCHYDALVLDKDLSKL